jgi:uncharacterized protein YndB with AHSA1/START domain
MKRDEEPVVVEQDFPCSTAVLWQAISDLDRMRRWYFDRIPAFRAEVGFTTRFDIDSGARVFAHVWKVVEVDPGRRLAYSWRYDGYPGASTSIFEVLGNETGSRLILTCVVNEDFPDDIPEFTRDSCLGGWRYFVNESLKNYLQSVS